MGLEGIFSEDPLDGLLGLRLEAAPEDRELDEEEEEEVTSGGIFGFAPGVKGVSEKAGSFNSMASSLSRSCLHI